MRLLLGEFVEDKKTILVCYSRFRKGRLNIRNHN